MYIVWTLSCLQYSAAVTHTNTDCQLMSFGAKQGTRRVWPRVWPRGSFDGEAVRSKRPSFAALTRDSPAIAGGNPTVSKYLRIARVTGVRQSLFSTHLFTWTLPCLSRVAPHCRRPRLWPQSCQDGMYRSHFGPAGGEDIWCGHVMWSCDVGRWCRHMMWVYDVDVWRGCMMWMYGVDV